MEEKRPSPSSPSLFSLLLLTLIYESCVDFLGLYASIGSEREKKREGGKRRGRLLLLTASQKWTFLRFLAFGSGVFVTTATTKYRDKVQKRGPIWAFGVGAWLGTFFQPYGF